MDIEKENMKLKVERLRKWLVPVLAVVVMAESLWIVVNAARLQGKWQQVIPEGVPGIKLPIEQKPVGGELVLEETGKKGEVYQINVVLQPSAERLVDGIDVVLGFEPETVTIKAANGESGLKMVRQVVDEEKGKVILTFLIDETSAGKMLKEPVTLAVLQVIPKREAGQVKLTPIKAESVMTETGSSKQYMLQGDALVLNVE